MKYQLVLVAGLLGSMVIRSASAQTIGLRGGLNLATQQQRVLGQNVENDGHTGFHVGLISDFALSDNLSIRPELLFSQKGLTASSNVANIISGTYTDKLSYITLPVTLAGKLELGPGKLVVGAGPYVAALVSGRREGSLTVFGFTARGAGDLKIGSNNDDDYRLFDAGVNLQAGYEISRFWIGANYGLGLTNVQRVFSDDNNYRRNRCLELGIGVYLTEASR